MGRTADCRTRRPGAGVTTAKNEVRRILDEIPDDVTLEDIQYHIYVCQKVERGLKDADAGRVLTQAEVERRMAKWLGQ